MKNLLSSDWLRAVQFKFNTRLFFLPCKPLRVRVLSSSFGHPRTYCSAHVELFIKKCSSIGDKSLDFLLIFRLRERTEDFSRLRKLSHLLLQAISSVSLHRNVTSIHMLPGRNGKAVLTCNFTAIVLFNFTQKDMNNPIMCQHYMLAVLNIVTLCFLLHLAFS